MRQFVLFPLLIVLYEMSAYLSNDMYLPALPQIMDTLNTSHELVQLTMTSWLIGSGAFQLILGPLSDRFGRRPIFLLGGLIFVISTVFCGFTSNITALILARFAQGSTICFVLVAGYASIHEAFDQKKAVQILAWMASIIILAPAFGPLVGSLILYAGSYRLIFYILALVGLVLLVALLFFMPETNPDGKTKHPLKLGETFKSYGRIFWNLDFLSYALTFGLLLGSMIAWIVAGPFLVIDTFKKTPVIYGLLQAVVFGGFILGTRTVKLIMDKFEINKLVHIGLSFILSGSVLLMITTWQFNSLLGLILSLISYTMGVGMLSSPLNRLAIDSSKEPMGQKVAVYTTIAGVFAAAGSLAVSLFYNETALSLALIMSVGGFIACLIKWLKKPS